MDRISGSVNEIERNQPPLANSGTPLDDVYPVTAPSDADDASLAYLARAPLV